MSYSHILQCGCLLSVTRHVLTNVLKLLMSIYDNYILEILLILKIVEVNNIHNILQR